MAIPADVRTWISLHFPENDREAAAALLTEATDVSGNPAGDRLIRCAALASTGNLNKLRSLVEELRIDWRDVIVAGEYEERAGVLVQVRDLNRSIPDA
jgi:hypothetical protein